jgi:hypothetical protein
VRVGVDRLDRGGGPRELRPRHQSRQGRGHWPG